MDIKYEFAFETKHFKKQSFSEIQEKGIFFVVDSYVNGFPVFDCLEEMDGFFKIKKHIFRNRLLIKSQNFSVNLKEVEKFLIVETINNMKTSFLFDNCKNAITSINNGSHIDIDLSNLLGKKVIAYNTIDYDLFEIKELQNVNS